MPCKYVASAFAVLLFCLAGCGSDVEYEHAGEPSRVRVNVALNNAFLQSAVADKNAYYRDGHREGLLHAAKYFSLANNFYISKANCEAALLTLDLEQEKNNTIQWCQDTWSKTLDSQQGCIDAAKIFFLQITPNMCVSALQ